MKKLLYAVLLCVLALAGLSAQSVQYYDFKQEQGSSYTSLADASSIDKMTEAPKDRFPFMVFNTTESKDFGGEQSVTMAGIPLGFDFTYEGQVYDKFVVSGMGYICLGLKSEENNVTVNLAGNPTLNNMYRMVAKTIGVSTNVFDTCDAPVRYKAEGTDGSKTMTVEFSTRYNGVDAVFHYQVKLYEDGKIEMLFDEFKTEWSWDPFVVGISGAQGANYYLQSDNGTFNDVFRATNNGGKMYSLLSFDKGLKYTFTPPAACEAPTATATLQVNAYSASAVLNLGVSGEADAYIIVASENPITGNPEDGKTYTEGDELAGGTVLAVREGLGLAKYEIEHSDRYKNALKSNTKYYYAVWFYNFKCSGDIKYGSVTKVEATTLTTAPASLEITAVSAAEIKVKATANSLNEEVLIAVTNNHGTDKNNNVLMKGDFGIPADNARVGDTIYTEDGEFGGKVVYVGTAGTEATVAVVDNKIYHFGAFSKHSDGKYSSVFAPADTITLAQIPYFEDFAGMIPFMVPIGWTGTDPQFSVASRNAGISYTFQTSTDGSVRQTNFVLPAMNYPEKAVRLVMEYNMQVSAGGFGGSKTGYKRTHWAETDSIVFEVSTDQGRTFRPAYAITKANSDQFASTEYLTRSVTIKGFENASQARLQMRWVSAQQLLHVITIKSLRLIEVPDCDYPLSVSIDPESIVGDKASVQWEVGESGEQAWNISMAMKSGNAFGEWSEAIQVAKNPYELTELAMNTAYKVRVQAVCGVGSTSEWVESSEFTSGWSVPFIEDFNNLPVVMSGFRASINFPNSWQAWYQKHNPNEIGDTLKPAEMTEAALNQQVRYFGWKTIQSATPGTGNAALTYQMRVLSGTLLLQLPVLQLDEVDEADFVFSAAFGTYAANTFTKATRTDTAYSIRVLVSEDGGKTFVVKDALQVWDSTDMVAMGDSIGFKISLAKYKGKQISLALAVSGINNSKAENQYLWIDNMGVTYDCATPRNLKVSDIEKTTATLTWKADPMVEEWIVKVSDGKTTDKFAVQGNTTDLTDLDSATFYTVALAHLCGEDTSAWATVSFTTAGVECNAIAGLAVSEITRNSAKLTWTGDALRYKIRLRKVGTSDWANYTAQTEEYVFTALLTETEYEGGVQSVCGEAASDTSDWVSFQNFTTLAQTCFAPEDLAATPSYASAELSWKGDADNYQVAYRKEGTTAVLGVFNVEGKTYTLAGLSEKTPYEARVRSACGAGDTSAWCEWVAFTTTETPACPVPSDLKAEGITLTSANLSWNCADAEASFILRFRPSSATSWDSVKALTSKTYELKDLTENTAYTWSVMAACSDNRYSGWATASNFTTLEETAVETSAEAALQVTAGKGQIHILNPSALQISRVRLLGTDGALLGNWPVNRNENVLLTTNHSMRVVVVVVESGNKMLRYKVLLP
ncbi:MAG: fibronectin type III domain-containing protein [Bacteroides sp.]|nr:fibronectin type III domain-containing protein [Ruminococcus flavefaciens]MCM1554982.1 fibronectin type III domain-containing protein [Bacteroides sp.]